MKFIRAALAFFAVCCLAMGGADAVNMHVGTGRVLLQSKACQLVGGVCVGAPGTGIFAGFTLSWGDAFNNLDAVGPGNPNGKYFMTRGYGCPTCAVSTGFRSSTTFNFNFTDPNTTGYLDVNRGVPVGYPNVRVSGNVLTLQTRAATAAEITTFPVPATNLNVGAIVNSDGAIGYYPTSTCPVIFDGRMRFNNQVAAGWTGAYWSISNAPIAYSNANEYDLFEVSSVDATQANANEHTWTANVDAPVNGWVSYGTYDTNFHQFAIKLAGSSGATAYRDGISVGTQALDTNSKAQPQYFLLDDRNNNGGTGFNQATWNASGTTNTSGSWMDVNYVQVWRKTGCPHYMPLTTIGTAQPEGGSGLALAYNGTGSITLPSKAALWGDGSVTEYVQCRPFEPTEPGTALATSYQQFPSYVTYNTGTRVVSVDFSANTGNAGVLHCMVAAYQTTGATFQPARFNIYRAPNVTLATVQAPLNASFSQDVYLPINGCDVGIVTPKTMTVTGLPTGLSFSPTTFLITGTATVGGTSTLTVGCTNHNGQTTSASVSIVVSTFSLVFEDSKIDTAGGTVITYNAGIGGNPNFGPASPNRRIAVCAGARMVATQGITSMTIGGIAATQAPGAAVSVATGETSDIWYATVPTGTSGAVVITWAGAAARSGIAVYSTITATAAPTAGTNNSATGLSNGGTVSTTITVPASGGGIACVFGRDATSGSAPIITAHSFTNATSNFFNGGALSTAGSSQAAGIITGTGSIAVTDTISTAVATAQVLISAAAWGP